VRKVKLLKTPKYDLGALLALHGDSATDDSGQKVWPLPFIQAHTKAAQVEKEFKETVLEKV
jgi:small subunit ribosomal protein S3Ae